MCVGPAFKLPLRFEVYNLYLHPNRALTPKATWATEATNCHSFSMYAGDEERPAAWATRFQRRDASDESWQTLNFMQMSSGATAATANWSWSGIRRQKKAEKGGKSEENNGWKAHYCGSPVSRNYMLPVCLYTEITGEKMRLGGRFQTLLDCLVSCRLL